MAYEKLLYEVIDGVARISFNDPATLNSVTEAMGAELLDALDRAQGEARAVLLTGEGKGFCSGANLADAQAMIDDPRRDVGGQLDRVFNPALIAIRQMEIPVVTAVRGAAAGFGAGLAISGDIVLFSETAYLFLAFRNVGLVPDGGASYLLAKSAGRVRAMELMLLGGKLPAEKALEWGVVNRVIPDAELDEQAMAMARELAAGPRSLAFIKRMAWDALDSSFENALGAEARFQRAAGRTEDFVEGVRSFAERRKPAFKGR